MRHAEGDPEDADAKMIAKAGAHRDDRRQIAAIETALREVAGDKRGEGIAHEIAAGRAEQAREALREHRRRGEHRKAGEAEREIQRSG